MPLTVKDVRTSALKLSMERADADALECLTVRTNVLYGSTSGTNTLNNVR